LFVYTLNVSTAKSHQQARKREDINKKAVQVWRKSEERSCNHCCSRKAISITNFECVFVALGCTAWHMHAPSYYLWSLRLYCIFSIITMERFLRKKKLLNVKLCF